MKSQITFDTAARVVLAEVFSSRLPSSPMSTWPTPHLARTWRNLSRPLRFETLTCLLALAFSWSLPKAGHALVVNEVVASNRTSGLDYEEDASDWLEVLHDGDAP